MNMNCAVEINNNCILYSAYYSFGSVLVHSDSCFDYALESVT